jgi:hypothetical protein
MTRFIVICMLFYGLSFPAHAQLEFAPIGAEWVYNSPVDADNFGYDPLESFESYHCTGDSMIDGQVFRKVEDLLFLQEGNKVYLWFQDTLRLIYDFGLDVGDTVELTYPSCLIPNAGSNAVMYVKRYVLDTTTIIIADGQPLKKFGFREWNGTHFLPYVTYEYIEKIGNPQFFIGDCPLPGTFLSPWLRCYKDSTIDYKSVKLLSYNISDCYYLSPSSVDQMDTAAEIKIAPNPITDQLTIHLEGLEVSNLTISDFSGRAVYHHPGIQSGTIQVDSYLWHQGIYFCHARYGLRLLLWKIVK